MFACTELISWVHKYYKKVYMILLVMRDDNVNGSQTQGGCAKNNDNNVYFRFARSMRRERSHCTGMMQRKCE